MLQTLRNAWKVPEIRKKLLVTLFILLLYRVGTAIPVPFVNAANFSSTYSGTILEYLNVLSGGSLGMATLFALGISPYITASIVIQLLTVAIPVLGRWAKDGEEGKKKLNNLTRYATVILAVVTSVGYYFLLSNSGMIASMPWPRVFTAFVIIVSYCAGAALVMWLGEKINEYGFGNGISMILFANIVSSLPSQLYRMGELVALGYGYNATNDEANFGLWGSIALVFVLVLIFVALAMLVFSVFVTESERRIPVQYAKRVVGRKMYGGQSSSLPLKLNMSGVMPVIFASSIISLPATIMAFCGVASRESWADVKTFGEGLNLFMSQKGVFYPIAFFFLIIAFSYFYIQISFDPIEVSNNLKKNGGMIPGIRQGKPTADYIRRSLNKITLVGAFFLSIVAILPIIAVPLVMDPLITKILAEVQGLAVEKVASSSVSYFTSAFSFGGTSLLIMIGVALETVRDLEAQLSMRSYKGFLN